MNKKSLLIILFLGSFSLIDAKYVGKKSISSESKVYDCQCYCSYKCGPRDPDQPGDAPFIDPETGICFCKERDREKYFVHGCDKFNNAKGFKTCCEPKYKQRTKRSFARTNYYKK